MKLLGSKLFSLAFVDLAWLGLASDSVWCVRGLFEVPCTLLFVCRYTACKLGLCTRDYMRFGICIWFQHACHM